MVKIESEIIYKIDKEYFAIGNIVEVQTNHITVYIGRLSYIDTAYIEIDMSEKYLSNIVQVKPDEILYITRINKEE